jgi:hypothetical protein
MSTRFVVAALIGFLVSGLVEIALGAPGKAGPSGPTSSVLCLNSLRGSLQGQCGIVLDVNGDGNEDLVIGAPYAQGPGTKGALLVYPGAPAGFPQRPSLLLEGEGNLGWSLASLGDLDGDGKGYFAAGAFSGSSDEASLAGTVTIYKGGVKPQKVAVLSGENALDKFGYSLAVGDLNGDGLPDLVVGAPFHSPSPALYQRGAVYVFFGDRTTILKKEALKIPATSAYGGIGFSLATGDINGDGKDDLLLQASGRVVAFHGAASFNPAVTGPNLVFTNADAGFGKSIAVLDDGNVAIGADQAGIAGVSDSGRLYIFNGAGNQLAKIDGEPNGGRFGSAILPVGPGLAVSAVHADGDPWPATGKIFLFNGSLTAGATVNSARVIAGEVRNMHLGSFLALVAQGPRLAAGAPTEDANTGKVRLFNLP